MSTKKSAVCIDCGEVRWVNRPARNERCRSCASKEFVPRRKKTERKRKEKPQLPSCLICQDPLRKLCSKHCRKCAAHVSGSQKETRVKRSASCRQAMERPEVKEAHRQKARENAARLKNSDEFRVKISLSQGGDGDLSRMNSSFKREDANWRKDVKERDNYMCQSCGSNDKLHAHHIKPKSAFPNLRHDLSNGITLCYTCHLEEHRNMKTNSIKGHSRDGITRADLITLLGG